MFLHGHSAIKHQYLKTKQKCGRNEITTETTFDCHFQSMESWGGMKHVDFCGGYKFPSKKGFKFLKTLYYPQALPTIADGSVSVLWLDNPQSRGHRLPAT